MSSKTPTKPHSASKKTPSKSTSKKQQPQSLYSQQRQTPKSSNKSLSLVENIKREFFQALVLDDQFNHKELSSQLKRILSVQGVQLAAQQLVQLIMSHNLPYTSLQQSLSKLSSQNLTALIYLIQQVISHPNLYTKVQLTLTTWINAIWATNPQLVCYNHTIKQSIQRLSKKHAQNNSIDIIKGKIALITGV